MKTTTCWFCDVLFLLGVTLFLSGIFLLFGAEITLIIMGAFAIFVSMMFYANNKQ